MGNYLPGSNSKKQQSQNSNNVPINNNLNNIDDYSNNYQQQYQQQNNFDFTANASSRGGRLRILNDKAQDKDKKIVAVIITFCNSSSYDNLFTTVQQKSMEGTKVQVYACDSSALRQVIDAFEGKSESQIGKRLMKSLAQVDPDCVVLNWECSSGYSCKTFTEGADLLFRFVKKIVDKGHMAMFSDFSLKALVNQWHDKYELGPNPFVQIKQHSGNFVIKFNPGTLKECPSAQLQMVGQMAETGMCNVHAAGGTIVYSVDSSKLNHNIYKLQVLTVVTSIMPNQNKYISTIGEHKGSAGHVLITYPSGGMILTSMGHWVELMKIDTSATKIFEVAQRQFGAEKAMRMRQQYQAMDVYAQQAYISQNAVQFVKNQAPCKNMSKKSRNY